MCVYPYMMDICIHEWSRSASCCNIQEIPIDKKKFFLMMISHVEFHIPCDHKSRLKHSFNCLVVQTTYVNKFVNKAFFSAAGRHLFNPFNKHAVLLWCREFKKWKHNYTG